MNRNSSVFMTYENSTVIGIVSEVSASEEPISINVIRSMVTINGNDQCYVIFVRNAWTVAWFQCLRCMKCRAFETWG